MKTVFITGVTGQDGYYLAEYLTKYFPEHKVIGFTRSRLTSSQQGLLLDQFGEKFTVQHLDIRDGLAMKYFFKHYRPDYFVNFAASTNPSASWRNASEVFECNVDSVARILERIHLSRPSCRFFSAGSSLELGDAISNEIKTPYALSKSTAGKLVSMFRDEYGIFATHGILFNHTSPRSKENFSVCKITKGAARIFLSMKTLSEFEPIVLDGDIYNYIDWSDSREIVRGVWDALQQKKPLDSPHFCSGIRRQLSTIIFSAFYSLGIVGEWRADGLYLPDSLVKGMSVKSNCLVRINPSNQHTLADNPYGDVKKMSDIGWKIQIPFDTTIRNMVEYYLTENKKAINIRPDNKEVPIG